MLPAALSSHIVLGAREEAEHARRECTCDEIDGDGDDEPEKEVLSNVSRGPFEREPVPNTKRRKQTDTATVAAADWSQVWWAGRWLCGGFRVRDLCDCGRLHAGRVH